MGIGTDKSANVELLEALGALCRKTLELYRMCILEDA